MAEAIKWILFILTGFLSGSVLYGKLIPLLIKKKDVTTTSDDGNPGTANAFIHGGFFVGTLTLLLELLKGVVPVLVCALTMDHSNMAFIAVVAAPVMGHAVGLFNHFHGGKCIAVSFGVLLGAIPASWIPLAVLVAFYVFFSTLVTIDPNRIRSIVTYALVACVGFAATLAFGTASMAGACVIVSFIAIIKHTRLFAKIDEPEVWKVCVLGRTVLSGRKEAQVEEFQDEQAESYSHK